MSRFVIEPQVALALAAQAATVPPPHRLLAPTLLRSQVLALLHAQVQAGALTRAAARQQLEHLRRLPMRLLGDRVLQRVAWDIAVELDEPHTFTAEYLALTRLQADALVTDAPALAALASRLAPPVPVVPMAVLTG